MRAKYDKAHEGLPALLQTIGEEEWERETYTLGERRTVEGLFRVHPRHFREHAAEIALG